MKIVRLSAKNVKRLRAVEVTPDGNVVVVGGKNGQGKSSLLDSIMYAIGGKDATCREPLRRGERSGSIEVDLGDMVVRRTFGADGSRTLVLEGKDGARFTQPQTRLDDLIGSLSFDPLEFTRMDPKRQAETLRALLGLDFSKMDAERIRLFEERTVVNRDGKQLRARYDAMPVPHEGVPASEVASADVLAELDRATSVNAANAAAHREHESLVTEAADAFGAWQVAARRVDELRAELARAEEAVAARATERNAAQTRANDAGAAAERLVDVDLGPIRARLASLEDTNRKVRENLQRAELHDDLETARAYSAELTAAIEAIDAKKKAAISSAAFPVAGLGFDETGLVTFGGLPFDQASGAEQLRASVAIGMALNPKLRVLLIRDGSLLDEESLAMMAAMADSENVQLWIERVEDGGATVVIEDGVVAEAAQAQAAS